MPQHAITADSRCAPQPQQLQVLCWRALLRRPQQAQAQSLARQRPLVLAAEPQPSGARRQAAAQTERWLTAQPPAEQQATAQQSAAPQVPVQHAAEREMTERQPAVQQAAVWQMKVQQPAERRTTAQQAAAVACLRLRLRLCANAQVSEVRETHIRSRSMRFMQAFHCTSPCQPCSAPAVGVAAEAVAAPPLPPPPLLPPPLARAAAPTMRCKFCSTLAERITIRSISPVLEPYPATCNCSRQPSAGCQAAQCAEVPCRLQTG